MPSSIHIEEKALRRQRANDDLWFDEEVEDETGAAVGILAVALGGLGAAAILLAGIVFSGATWLTLAAAVGWLALQ